MALFVVQHLHDAGTCPASDPKLAPQFLLAMAGAADAGVNIRAEAVVDGAHELNLIVEAADAEVVTQFMQPFAQMGSVTVRAASACERVVDRGGC